MFPFFLRYHSFWEAMRSTWGRPCIFWKRFNSNLTSFQSTLYFEDNLRATIQIEVQNNGAYCKCFHKGIHYSFFFFNSLVIELKIWVQILLILKINWHLILMIKNNHYGADVTYWNCHGLEPPNYKVIIYAAQYTYLNTLMV